MVTTAEHIFLFVNPKSGGNKGQDFLKVPQPFVTKVADNQAVNLHIYSLPDKGDEGFKKLKQIADAQGSPVRTIVGGGDGTVMWADCVATRNGIDTSKQCVFGIVPLGTGNDFSRVAGWGGKNPRRILDNDCQQLREMVKCWCKAKVRPHDVWQVDIEVDEREGKVLKVSGTGEEEQPKKQISAPLINYFSIGQESKVGVEFDKHRTKSQTCNLLVYAWEGLGLELDCRSKQRVPDLVSSMHLGTSSEAPLLFGFSEEHEVPELIGNPESLMFLNVNSYAGGAGQFWQLDTPCGVDPEPKSSELDVEASPGDGRIEVVTLPSIANIALDQVSHEARRIHSGGPYYLEFFAPPEGEDLLDVFCEVDGEFYHLVNPLYASVTFLKKLQVLQNSVPESDWKKLIKSGKEIAAGVAATGMQLADGVAATGMQLADGVAATGREVASGAAAVADTVTTSVVTSVNSTRKMVVSSTGAAAGAVARVLPG